MLSLRRSIHLALICALAIQRTQAQGQDVLAFLKFICPILKIINLEPQFCKAISPVAAPVRAPTSSATPVTSPLAPRFPNFVPPAPSAPTEPY